jgi:hypothetical protein
MAPYVKDRRALLGGILVIAGLLLLLDNVRGFPDVIPWWVYTWQFLLIGIGVISLLTSERSTPGTVLIIIGSVFLVPRIIDDVWPEMFRRIFYDDWRVLWYFVVILVGLSLLFRGSRHRSFFHRLHEDRPDADPGAHAGGGDPNEVIDMVSVFGGGEKVITTDNFRGGKITVIFGGLDLDLTRATLAPGTHEIEVFALFGGWDMRVPPNWQIKTDVTPIFGGISDKRMIGPDVVKDNTRLLLIRGVVLFGGGEIKTI